MFHGCFFGARMLEGAESRTSRSSPVTTVYCSCNCISLDASSGVGGGPESDLAQATRLARRMVLQWGLSDLTPSWQAEVEPMRQALAPSEARLRIAWLLKEAEEAAQALLADRLGALYPIAAELMEAGEIGGARLARMVEEEPGDADAATIVTFAPAT